eukprot:503020-Pleurochrysis_carterae.AAC.5
MQRGRSYNSIDCVRWRRDAKSRESRHCALFPARLLKPLRDFLEAVVATHEWQNRPKPNWSLLRSIHTTQKHKGASGSISP